MIKIVFVEHSGTRHDVEAKRGDSLMQAALDHGVPDILGDCGGCCSCATCHAYIDPAWAERLPPRSEDEAMMLEGALEPRDTSRLACQVSVSEALDGMVVHLPARQI